MGKWKLRLKIDDLRDSYVTSQPCWTPSAPVTAFRVNSPPIRHTNQTPIRVGKPHHWQRRHVLGQVKGCGSSVRDHWPRGDAEQRLNPPASACSMDITQPRLRGHQQDPARSFALSSLFRPLVKGKTETTTHSNGQAGCDQPYQETGDPFVWNSFIRLLTRRSIVLPYLAKGGSPTKSRSQIKQT